MKIALFSDIHANLPALEAFFEDIEKHKPDAIYCLGDLVGYNIWPNEVINEIRKRRIPVIAGNYDQGIGWSSKDCGCSYKSELEKDMGRVSINLTNEWVRQEEREYLRTLPSHIRLTFQLKNETLSLLLVHGSPRKINEYLFEDRNEKSLQLILEKAEADILCFGHTHRPYHRVVASSTDNKVHFRHAINTGSLGKPKDNNPDGCYVLLTITEESRTGDRESIGVTFIRFRYDVEKAAKSIEESDLPNKYADMLRKGY